MLETRRFAYALVLTPCKNTFPQTLVRKDQRSSPFCPLGQSSPSLLKLKPWIRTWSVVAAETWKKVNSELSSWCRVTGTNTLADYKSNSFSDQQQKLSCRKKTIKKQKQLYLTSTDPSNAVCINMFTRTPNTSSQETNDAICWVHLALTFEQTS